MTHNANDGTGQQAIALIQGIADPIERARVAHHGIEELRRVRDDGFIAARHSGRTFAEIGAAVQATPQYIDRIVRGVQRGTAGVAAYAFRDESGTWHGKPRALKKGEHGTAWLDFNPVSPSPFAGQRLEVRYGPWAGDVNVYAVQLVADDGAKALVRDTDEVHGLLFPGHP
ncbi:MAG TPA: hypothetical protein VK547_09745 [Candidatus Udaeobacter sp.]|nr:hypothetical protein [Candidatus Udaeobacter sp.]